MSASSPNRMDYQHRSSRSPSRPAVCSPGGARIAFYVALNLEQYSFGEGLVEDLAPPLGQPDVMNYPWRDWAIASAPGACGDVSRAWVCTEPASQHCAV